MDKDEHLIWTNIGLNLEDWIEELKEDYPDQTEDKYQTLMHEINRSYLDDERANLNLKLSQPILIIADLGLWDGRRMGYKEIQSGNIADCLYSDADKLSWYVDGHGEFRCTAVHHDGVNLYRYRTYRDNISENKKEILKEKLYRGTATEKNIELVTKRIGPYIGKIYGWKFKSKDGVNNEIGSDNKKTA